MRLTTLQVAAAIALMAEQRSADEMTDQERKTPPPPPESKPVAKNLPGETNRQFAARMKAEREAAAQSQERRAGE